MEISKKINNIVNDLINITDTIIIYNNLNSNFILEKNNTNKIIETKEFIKNNKIIKNNLNKEISEEYRKEIINFFDILKNKLNHCNFDTLNNNIRTIDVISNYFKYCGDCTKAAYNTNTNKIILNKKNFKKYISHELLHMSTCKKINNKYICTGFDLINVKKFISFGVFINEGYTELLNEKYFVRTDCYLIHKVFIRLLELIIGKDLMEKMYFNSDIVGLINNLMKYNNSLEDVIKFILNTDIIHKSIYKLSIIKRYKLRKALIEVNDFLIHSYYEKVKTYAKNESDIDFVMQLFITTLKSIKLDIGYNDKYMKDIDKYKEKKLIKN